MTTSVRNIILCFCVASFAAVLHADVVTGKVVGVTDGDTVKVLTAEKREVKVRLYGVDAPEKAQAFGQKAKQFTSDLVFGKEVRVEVIEPGEFCDGNTEECALLDPNEWDSGTAYCNSTCTAWDTGDCYWSGC